MTQTKQDLLTDMFIWISLVIVIYALIKITPFLLVGCTVMHDMTVDLYRNAPPAELPEVR